MRRAISCVYCEPKSRTAIASVALTPRPPGPLPGAPQLLGLLKDLALGLDGRGDDQLCLLQFADVGGPHRAHARPDGAHQVEGAVLREGRAEEDLLQRAGDADPDARPAREI